MQPFKSELQNIYKKHPKYPCLTFVSDERNDKYSFEELISRVYDYCLFYQGLGIQKNEIVLIILKESLDLFASFIAGMIIGALPAYFAYPSPKQTVESFLDSIKYLYQYNQIRIVISFAEVIHALRISEDFSQLNCLEIYDHHTIPTCNATDLEVFPTPDHEAFLQFSSGTTGAKKGVKISSIALFNQIQAYSQFVDFDHQSKVVSWLPHYHDMGLIACMLMPILKTIPIIMMSPFDWVRYPKMLLDAITCHKATHLWLPNFALGHLSRSIDEQDLRFYDLSSITQLVCCSEPLLDHNMNEFIEKFKTIGLDWTKLYNCYAMAENTFAMTSTRKGDIKFLSVDLKKLQDKHIEPVNTNGHKVASVGIPLPNTKIHIIDSHGKELEEDQVGEVIIKSDCMLEEYHNNPSETRDSFNDGWFKTGDLGFFHQGELYITGRRKDIIIVGGVNIYPYDIEIILNNEPGLIPGRNVVFGVDNERIGTEGIIILAEKRSDNDIPDIVSVRNKIFNVLGVSVSDFILLPHMTLKKGTAGKISRYLNKQAYLRGEFSKLLESEPTNSLIDIISDLIPGSTKPVITTNTPLISSGLIDSFGFVDMLSGLEEYYQIKIPNDYWRMEYFQTLNNIEKTISRIRGNQQASFETEIIQNNLRYQSLQRLLNSGSIISGNFNTNQYIINHSPITGSVWFRLLFRLAGVKMGKNVKFLGRVSLIIHGKASNITIGDNVKLGDNVDIRNREDGKIILQNNVNLDHNVRVVAARDGIVEIGTGSRIGRNTVINSGGITNIGRFCLIASNVNINSSSHGIEFDRYIQDQPHRHGIIEIGDDVWVGAGSSILINSKIGEGSIIASNSLVSGEIPPFAVCMGIPAKVIRYR